MNARSPADEPEGAADAEPRDPRLTAFGERLRTLRARRGLTRKAVAQAAEVSERYLANLEHGTGNASLLILDQIARALQCSVAEVIGNARTVAVLEGVNDHENLGSIFRNAAGLDVDAVVFGSGCADPLYRRAVRVSMGHALLVPYASAEGWPATLNMLSDKGFRLLAMTPDPAAATLADAMAQVDDDKVAVLVGGEGPGLTETAMRASDMRVRIPMSGGTDSLNVATAAALAFYDRARLAR